MCRLIILCCFSILSLTNSVIISVNDEEKTIDVLGPELNGQDLDTNVKVLNISFYDEGEKEIHTITNFPSLTKITISNVGQRLFPKFSDVPLLNRVNVYATEITALTRNIFSDTNAGDFYLKNNKISSIERYSFIERVYSVSLSCNHLTKFYPTWFQGPQNLRILNLRGNKISEIQENAFQRFVNLDDLNLGYNNIVTIGPGAFAHRNQFIWLFLHNNNLKELSENIFGEKKVTIENFYLNSNNLTYLPKKFMDKVKVNERAPIEGNPWQCSCYNDIIKWVPWKHYGTWHFPKETEGEVRCVAALSFQATCVETIDYEIIQHFWSSTNYKVTSREEYCECTKDKECL